MHRLHRSLVSVAALLVALLPGSAVASSHGGGQDHAGAFTTINVSEDHPAGDIACMFCTVNLDGDVHGDVAVLFGTVNGTADHTISGDVAVLFSTLSLGDNSRVNGDLASAFSTIDIPASTSVRGDRSVFATGFGISVLLAPLLLLLGVVWLIVHLVRDNRARYAYPPTPRRF